MAVSDLSSIGADLVPERTRTQDLRGIMQLPCPERKCQGCTVGKVPQFSSRNDGRMVVINLVLLDFSLNVDMELGLLLHSPCLCHGTSQNPTPNEKLLNRNTICKPMDFYFDDF